MHYFYPIRCPPGAINPGHSSTCSPSRISVLYRLYILRLYFYIYKPPALHFATLSTTYINIHSHPCSLSQTSQHYFLSFPLQKLHSPHYILRPYQFLSMPSFDTGVLDQLPMDRVQYQCPGPVFADTDADTQSLEVEVISLEQQMMAEVQRLENDHKVLRACVKKSAESPVPVSALPISLDDSCHYICPVAALALLEIIARRRNLIAQETDVNDVLVHAANGWESRGERCRFDHIEHFHTRWAAKEQIGQIPRISS